MEAGTEALLNRPIIRRYERMDGLVCLGITRKPRYPALQLELARRWNRGRAASAVAWPIVAPTSDPTTTSPGLVHTGVHA
jgi:hypothetical protein